MLRMQRLTHFELTSTRTGFDKLARWSLATLVVIVAEKRYVVRSFGMSFKILSSFGPKSMSSSLSASSSTYSIPFSSHPSTIPQQCRQGVHSPPLVRCRPWRWCSLHAAVPQVKAAYNQYVGAHTSRSGDCESWVDWYGEVVCDLDRLVELTGHETLDEAKADEIHS